MCYHTNFCHSRSNNFGVHRGLDKFWGCWSTTPLKWGHADPLKHATPTCYHTNFRCCRSNCLGISRVPKNFGDAGARPPGMGKWLTTRNMTKNDLTWHSNTGLHGNTGVLPVLPCQVRSF